MADDKKQSNTPQPLRESVDFGENVRIADLTRKDGFTTTVSQRVPITPAPPRPPERDKK